MTNKLKLLFLPGDYVGGNEEKNYLHNKANALSKNRILKKRLTPLHHKLIIDICEGDLVEFGIKSNHYLVANEDDKLQLELIRRNSAKWDDRKSLNGASYPVPNIVGYYFCYLTPETTGRADWGDSIMISPTSKVGGVIDIPLEAIVSYELVRRRELK